MPSHEPPPDQPGAPGAAPLPELKEELLDAAGLERFFTDLEGRAEALALSVKAGPEQRGKAGEVTLREAGALLLAGSCAGVQLRYRQGSAFFCDTLLAAAGSVKLIRFRFPG